MSGGIEDKDLNLDMVHRINGTGQNDEALAKAFAAKAVCIFNEAHDTVMAYSNFVMPPR